MSFIYKDAVNNELDKLLLLYKMGSIPKDTVKKNGVSKVIVNNMNNGLYSICSVNSELHF